MAADHVVIDHHHDETNGVYQVVVGVPIIETQPLVDDEGLVMLDDDGKPLAQQVTVGYEDVVDVVFAADDRRWRGRSDADIAADQREIVQASIARRDDLADDATPKTKLPGIGDALGSAS